MSEDDKALASSVIKILPTANENLDCVLLNHDCGQLRGRSSSIALVGDLNTDIVEPLISANIEILDMHISELGDYWACDERGNVYTTADVDLPGEPIASDIEMIMADNQLNWQIVKIHHKPLVLIWTVNNFVWAMAADGKAFLLMSGEWKEYDIGDEPIAIAGGSYTNLYLITASSSIYHFFGFKWLPVKLPETGLPLVVYTDILAVDEHNFLITAKNGLLLFGNIKEGFEILDAPVLEYFGVSYFKGRYFFAAGSDGVYDCQSLQEPLQLNKLKDAKGPLSIELCANRLNMTISEHHQQARFITLLPSEQLGEVDQCLTV